MLPYCWYEQTPLSNQETRLDDAYKMRQDPAVTVDMPLHGDRAALDGANALIWTTTPWTLPSNLAIAVHPDIDYVQVRGADGKRYVLAKERARRTTRANWARRRRCWPSTRVRSWSACPTTRRSTSSSATQNAHRVLAADYVTTDSGTGIVHLAPAFGEEDMDVATANGIEVVQPLDPGGKFTAMVPPYEGLRCSTPTR